MNRPLRLVVAALVVPTISALAATVVCWPIHDGPLGPQLLVCGLVVATGISAGLPACLTWLTPKNPEN
ncbi:hypothetical protein ACFC6U_10400 [Kitasatospora purpeofusca]|uniref:hypothetical protein n=1 Tax=Kitasatospora purpeofusca TaxID=67352 RepID=UPI0035DB07FB